MSDIGKSKEAVVAGGLRFNLKEDAHDRSRLLVLAFAPLREAASPARPLRRTLRDR